jgi:hypothetical protein
MVTTLEEAKKKLAQGLYSEVRHSFERKPDPFIATALISHANKHLKNISISFNIYNTLKLATKPNNYVYSTLARACQDVGQCSHLASLWNDITSHKEYAITTKKQK